MSSALPYYDDCIMFLLAKAYQKVLGVFKKRLREYGLTPVQNLVIMALFEEEGASAGELSRRLTIDNATLSGVLDRLAEGGWIIKETTGDDRRALQIYLTQKGKDIVRTLLEVRDQVNEDVLGKLKLEEQLLLKRILKDLQG